jgi:peptidoglycan/LPS O-acetylase OafA/YrhL
MSTEKSSNMQHISELDGLRGLLAIWVLVYHGLTISDNIKILPAKLAEVIDGSHAVEVFIIMSGFVITRLLVVSQEKYSQFIFRRLVRIYPTYLIAISLSILFQILGWMPVKVLPSEIIAYALSHITILFGALPESIPGSGSKILNPAWSISLEWQFYLIAPLLIGFLKDSRAAILVSAICLFSSRLFSPLFYSLNIKFSGAFLLSSLSLFWVGISSFLLYQWFCSDRRSPKYLLLGFFFFILFFLPYLQILG